MLPSLLFLLSVNFALNTACRDDFERFIGYTIADRLVSYIIRQEKSKVGNDFFRSCHQSCQDDSRCFVYTLHLQRLECAQYSYLSGNDADLFRRHLKSDHDSIVFRKTCLLSMPSNFKHYLDQLSAGVPSCGFMWRYDVVPKMSVRLDYIAGVRRVESMSMCETLCTTEKRFQCRSAIFNYVTKNCHLSKYDRRSMPFDFHEGRAEQIYLENQCHYHRYRECDVSEQHGIASALAPSQTKVTDQKACKRACLENNKFLCRSYVFDPISGLCRFGPDDTYITVLLPSSSARMTPYRQINECMDIVVFCEHHHITAHFRSNNVFDGKVLSLNSSSGCQFNVDKRFDFNVTIPLDKTIRCGISPVASGIVSTLIKLQYHDIVWTTKDRFYRLICNYTPRRNSIDNFVDVSVPKNRMEAAKEVSHYREPVSNRMPAAYMRIVDNNGVLVSEAEEGQPLFIEINLQAENRSGKNFFVTDCVAYEKNKKTLLIDERGCPTNRSIMDEFYQTKWGFKGSSQRARFWGIPLHDQKRININCNVNFCLRDCPSVRIDYRFVYSPFK
ncbi:plasminogen protein B [Trichuris trichiura]|uniref:Plasminogen protein B n=1 Tax=Trichuris trichiura TaxID=36087 RepID=A0A077ZF09_TRITR|nr:plasminogen protein B [Trichuris trichiura]